MTAAIACGPESPLVAASIMIALKEWVKLDRGDRNIDAYVTVWETYAVGASLKKDMRELRKTLGDLVDQFINDYLAANPKK